jgi:hypothetical protein
MLSRVRTVLVTLLVVITLLTGSLWLWARRNLWYSAAIPIAITRRVADVYFDPRKPLPEFVTEQKLWGDRNDPGREHFRRATAPVIADIADELERAWALTIWTRSQARKVSADLEQTGDPYAVLVAMQAGKGALCGPFALVLREALVANGIPARRVQFMREPPFLSEGHAAVEAFVNGKWVLLDPTFVAYWKVNGVPASLWELRNAHIYRPWGKVEMVESPLPPRETLAQYHVSYAAHLNAVLYEYYEHPLAKRYGLIRYPFLKLLQSNFMQLVKGDPVNRERGSALRINNILVQLIYIQLPIAFIVCAILLAGTYVIGRPSRSSQR